MIKLTILIVLLALSFGCFSATPTTMMVNLRTGDVKQCRAIGHGVIGVSLANSSHDKCVEQLQGVGYKRSEELTPEEKANLPKK